jgi:N-acetylglucosamine-6-phosphate deacetylase
VDETRVFGRVVAPEGVIDDGLVVVAGGRIEYVGRAPAHRVAGEPADDLRERDRIVLPGLVDVHNHGGGGASFTAADPEALANAAAYHLRCGTTTVVASVVADAPQAMMAAVAATADAVEGDVVAAVHVEGPFLAPRRCGAQDPRHLLAPDKGLARDLVAAGRGHVRVMTVAPELEGAEEVIGVLLEHGVVPAVGHTEAAPGIVRQTLADTRAALGRPGLVSHLFNGMPQLHHRHPGPVAGALSAAAAGEARVELIADGVHLADDTVRTVFDLLGPGRIVLVTDAMAAAGMPDGSYDLGPQRVRVVGGVARLGEGTEGPLAGGTANLLDVLRRCVRAGVDLASAVAAATSSPAAALGLDAHAGALAAGRPADLVVADAELRPLRVMRAGAWLD